MKKAVLSVALCLASLTASAQSYLLDNPANHAYFGVRASYELSCPGDLNTGGIYSEELFGNGSGLSLGLVYNQPLVANLFLEPGISFYYNTESIEEIDDVPVELLKNRSMRKFGLTVPVQVGYHLDFTPDISIALMTGPVLNVGFSNDYYLTTRSIAGYKAHESGSAYGDDGFLNRVDCAWRIGVGFTFAHNYFLGVSGDLGMCNMFKEDLDGLFTLHDNTVRVTLGYNF